MKLLLCINMLNALIQIWPQFAIPVGKLDKKMEKICPKFLDILKFCASDLQETVLGSHILTALQMQNEKNYMRTELEVCGNYCNTEFEFNREKFFHSD